MGNTGLVRYGWMDIFSFHFHFIPSLISFLAGIGIGNWGGERRVAAKKRKRAHFFEMYQYLVTVCNCLKIK